MLQCDVVLDASPSLCLPAALVGNLRQVSIIREWCLFADRFCFPDATAPIIFWCQLRERLYISNWGGGERGRKREREREREFCC